MIKEASHSTPSRWPRRLMKVGVLSSVLALGACSVDRAGALIHYNPDLDLDAAVERIELQGKLLALLGKGADIDVCQPEEAGGKTPGCRQLSSLTPTEWQKVTRMGLHMAEWECLRYIDSIFWFERAKDRTVNQFGLGAIATTAIVGLTGGSSEVLSIITSAFGLAGASVENVGSGLLYELGSSEVKELVVRRQQAFWKQFEKTEAKIQDRVRALMEIQNFASICLPPDIETEVRNAVKEAKLTTTDAGGTRVGVAKTDVTISSDPAANTVRLALLAFVRTGSTEVGKYLGLAKKAGIVPKGTPQTVINAVAIISDEKNGVKNALIAKDLKLIEGET